MDMTPSPNHILTNRPAAAWLGQQSSSLWIVGGALRDALVGRAAHDVDLVVAGDALAFARRMARALGGVAASIDPTNTVARVTCAASPIFFDIAALAGPDLTADLALRDFTVNALALPATEAHLLALLSGDGDTLRHALIDPFGGAADLAQQRLRLTQPDALVRDPVRVLRAARLMTTRDLIPDATTVQAARAVVPHLADMPGERLTAELYTMLAQRNGTRAMRALDDLGALVALVPPLIPCRGLTQGRLHHWDVFDHTLEVIDSMDRVVDLMEAHLRGAPEEATPVDLPPDRVAHPHILDVGGQNVAVLQRLRAPLAEGQTRLTMLKVAALFHDVGKPSTRQVRENGAVHFTGHAEVGVPITTPVLQGWKLGRSARRYIELVVGCHMRPSQLGGPQGLADKAARHYFRDAGDAGIDTAIFSLADHLAVYGPDPLTSFWHQHYGTVAELIRRVYEEPQRVTPPRLIDGNDLMARFAVPHGPTVGRILAQVETAHLNDEIQTRAEALALVERLLAETPTQSPS